MPFSSMTNMCGVFVAPYGLPDRAALVEQHRVLRPNLRLPSGAGLGAGALLARRRELIASQTIAFRGVLLGEPSSEPLACDAFTNGHCGLNHSSTTVLPRSWLSRCGLPSKSRSSKSGAGLPISAAPVTVGREEDDGDAADPGDAGASRASADGLAGLQAVAARRQVDETTEKRTRRACRSLALQLSGAPQMSHAQSLSLSATGI